MKPNRPYAVTSTKNYITVGWDSCDNLILEKIKRVEKINEEQEEEEEEPEVNSRWYVLQKNDKDLGWRPVYMGFKTQTEVGPMTPGDYYEFRVKVATKDEESEWSDTLFAATRDDVIPVAYLHRVVENGPVTTLRKMLLQRPSAVNVPNRFGHTPLKLALLKNNTSFMGILISNGADIELPETGSGRTPLMAAAIRGQIEVVQLLLEKGANLHATDRHGLTVLNYAVDNSYLPTVQFLLEEGADLKSRDKSGWTPLMRGVVLKSSVAVLAHLLDNGSDPNECDDNSQTVLMQAVVSGRPEVVELLLSKGAEKNVTNIYGHSAFNLAEASSNESIVKIAPILELDTEDTPENEKKDGK